MYPRAFAYHRAGSAAEAVDRLATHGDRARVLAGGMSLLPMMKYRQRAPEVLIDVGRLTELAGVALQGRVLRIGATARHHELAAWRAGPALAMVPELARRIGDPQVRNMGTVGGGLAAVEPTSDWATALLACRGEVVVRRAGGERRIAADDLFLDTHRSALAPDELLVEAAFSLPAGRVGTAHAKFEARAAAAAVMSAGVCL
ncbi:MAG TPA: FAD binding domain-containing protein, partial [Acidimicrobiales bacterium]|nr:FAD binding domain-containing protein [Acidimicrobiales bacterium]